MDTFFFNQTRQALVLYAAGDDTNNTISYVDVNITRSFSRLSSPLAVTVAVLLVFLFSPMILIGNSLVLMAMYRFKRLRTPSNYLVMSLSTSDLGIGMFMPIGMYLEVGGGRDFSSARMCLLSYGIAITLCSVSVLVIVAIAVDRFTSLARPLRYPNLITHSAVERYIIVFWAYSALVGFTPYGYAVFNGHFNTISTGGCSFGVLVDRPIQLFMFCAVYGPSAVIIVVCYGYIYFVARGHARAILEVRHCIHGSSGGPRYGLALAITTGLFIALWVPFQTCMLMDVFAGTNILTAWVSIYLALPILASSAFNPWIYGYRNAELRSAIRRIIDDFLTSLGFTYRSHHATDQVPPSAVVTAGDQASFINHVQRECLSWKPECDFLLVPIAKAENSISDSDPYRENSKIIFNSDKPKMLRESRSMVETLAIHSRGSDILVIKGFSCGMTHGASVV